MHPGLALLLYRVEKGPLRITFRATGRGDAPVHANGETSSAEFSVEHIGPLGRKNAAFLSSGLAASFWKTRILGISLAGTAETALSI